jgi:hypothetical protein
VISCGPALLPQDMPAGMVGYTRSEPAVCFACGLRDACGLRFDSRGCESRPHGEAWPRNRVTGEVRRVLQPDLPGWYRALRTTGGLEHRLVGHFADPQLPRIVHCVPPQAAVGFSVSRLSTVAVSLTHVLRPASSRVRSRAELLEAMNLPATTRLILVGSGRDHVMAPLFEEPALMATRIAEAGFDLVLSPAFSVWRGDPASMNRLLAVRSSDFACRLAARGSSVVPAAVWYQGCDLVNFVEAVRNHGSISTVWVDGGSWRGHQKRAGLAELRLFLRLCPDVKVVLCGVLAPEVVAAAPAEVEAFVGSTAMGALRANRGREAARRFRRRLDRISLGVTGVESRRKVGPIPLALL